MISYAQNFEDVLLYRCFGKLSDGFYVDIGAYHPVIASVTKVFYDAGWSGINVEPGAGIEALRRDRPRDVNLAVAVTDAEGEADFWEHTDDPGTSTLQADVVQAVAEKAGERVHRRVPTLSLARLLQQHAAGRHINFLKIDAEGAEDAIIAGGDWSTHRPEVLVIESTEPYTNRRVNAGWQGILQEARYSFAYFDGINDFWVRQESADLLKMFEVPVNVLDGYRLYDPEIINLQNALAEARETAVTAQGKLAEVQQELMRTADDKGALEATLANVQSDLAATRAAAALAESELLSAQQAAADTQATLAEAQAELLQAAEEKAALQASLADSQRDLRAAQAQAEAVEYDLRKAEQEERSARLAAADLDKWRQRLFNKLKAKDAPRELRLVLPMARLARLFLHQGERLSAEFKQPDTKGGKHGLIQKAAKSLKLGRKRAERLAVSGVRAALVPMTVQLARRAPKLFKKIRRDVRRKIGDYYEANGNAAENAMVSQEVEDAVLTLLLHGNQEFAKSSMITRIANK